MKTKRFYALAASRSHGGIFYSRLFVAALILALLLASFPAVSVLAAPAADRDPTANIDIEKEWQDKLWQLRWAGFYYENVRFYPADFEDSADLARVHELLEKYGIALRAANTIVMNHSGFDIEGNMKHDVQAARTVRELAMYLQIMRGFREKIGEIPHESNPLLK